MKLYDFMKLTEADYDTYDTVYDACVTVCCIDAEDEERDSYYKFCTDITKKVEMVKQNGDILIVDWTKLIKENMEHFKLFTENNWNNHYEDDEDEFMYQWINEIHYYMAGYVAEEVYEELVELVNKLKA